MSLGGLPHCIIRFPQWLASSEAITVLENVGHTGNREARLKKILWGHLVDQFRADWESGSDCVSGQRLNRLLFDCK